jgi:dTDP-4-amino-4,6-dideoxygalactose transaminase
MFKLFLFYHLMVFVMIPINKPLIGEEEVQAVREVINSGILTGASIEGGPKVREFESRFASFIGSKYAVAVSNGTAALHLALLAAGVGPGDEVIVPPFTFVATATAVLLVGAKPVFADINPETYNIDPENVRKVISSKTKAIIPVHLYGLPADMDPIMEIANDYNIIVIEDAAQAHGASYKGHMVGSIGHMGCFSFYATKNMTTGEGGMVTTSSKEYWERLRMLRTHGQVKGYDPHILGYNYRMPEIEAAIGLIQLSKLPRFLEIRKRNANVLSEMLSDVKGIRLPYEPSGSKHSWYLYTISVNKDRDMLLKKLNSIGIGASVYYEIPVHLTPLFRGIGFSEGMFPNAENAARQVLSLPIHPGLSENDMVFIYENVKKFLVG